LRKGLHKFDLILSTRQDSILLLWCPSMKILLLCLCCLPLSASEWISLFNGKDLSGWTPKIAGHPVGENAFDTFRVEDGILKCEYDRYPKFNGQFGHLYSNLAYSHYILRMEYKFSGEKMPDAPGYVNLNSGVMVHSQPPQSMSLEQGFPVSIEFQFLADEAKGPRPTGNVCTPGTNIEIEGKLITQHIVESTSPNYPADQWIQIEMVVRGDEEIIHRVNGKEVLRYQKPQLDPKGAVISTKELFEAGAPLSLKFGHIALQAEGQPVWFRNIKIKQLEASENSNPKK